MSAAYAPYRAALLQTNLKDQGGTERALAAFETAWGKLMATYRSAPPPQYADDPAWAATIGAVEQALAKAKAEAAKKSLPAAHDALEQIRGEFAALRARNSVITFSDHVDAYHEKMEQILTAKYGDDLPRLREDAAVLAHLAAHMRERAPASLARDAAFNEALQAVTESSMVLLAATRNGDMAAVTKALKALKPAYARFFVKFG